MIKKNMKTIVAVLSIIVCISTFAFCRSSQPEKPHNFKKPAVQTAKPAMTTAQVSILKQQVHVYTVWVRRTLDDCKRDDENDKRFDDQQKQMRQDNGDFHQKTINDIIEKKTAIRKEMDADLTESIKSYKLVQGNPLFQKIYLETERCYPDNFCPPGFQADQLAKMRFVEPK